MNSSKIKTQIFIFMNLTSKVIEGHISYFSNFVKRFCDLKQSTRISSDFMTTMTYVLMKNFCSCFFFPIFSFFYLSIYLYFYYFFLYDRSLTKKSINWCKVLLKVWIFSKERESIMLGTPCKYIYMCISLSHSSFLITLSLYPSFLLSLSLFFSLYSFYISLYLCFS